MRGRVIISEVEPMEQAEADRIPMTFAGGPTYMPPYLKAALKDKIFAANSYLNLNSNTKQFSELVEKARSNLRSIMDIPQDRQIWFLGGGCHLQFAGLPLNFLGQDSQATANYTTSGYFSKLAFNQAKRYCRAKSIMEYKVDEKGQFYLPEEFDFDPKAVYTHFIDNESVEGISYPDSKFPVVPGIPLFDDCSSSFLTRPLDWDRVDMAYAHAQKNCGISGLTVMVLNSKALETAPRAILPELCSFENYKRKNGYAADMNILPIYAHYVVTDYVLRNGGLRVNDYDRRAQRLYQVIDNSRIFKARVREEWRSKITVTWSMADDTLMQKCIEEGIKEDLYEFKGHRSIGGFRASLFCPIPDESAFRLADFLEDFANRHQ